MPLSRETARSLMKIVEQSGREFCTLLSTLEEELSPDEYKKIKREIGRVITTMDDCISSKVAAEFPDLAPEAVPIAHKL